MHVSHITNWSTYNWLFPSDFWPFTNITNELKEKGQKPTLHWTMGPPLTSWKLPLALVKGNRGSMKSYDCQKLHDVSHTGNDLISLKIAQITNYSKSSPIIALRRIWPNCIRPRIFHINRCFPWRYFNSTSQDLILSTTKIPPVQSRVKIFSRCRLRQSNWPIPSLACVRSSIRLRVTVPCLTIALRICLSGDVS